MSAPMVEWSEPEELRRFLQERADAWVTLLDSIPVTTRRIEPKPSHL